MSSKDLERFFALLPTFEHQKGIKLFDELSKDPANAAPILEELLLVTSNHDDPQLHTPHGTLTVESARDLLRFTRPPGGLGLLRFLVLYNFSLHKRALTPEQARANALAVPPGGLQEMRIAYAKAVAGNLGDQAAALLNRVATDHGFEVAAHIAIRTALNDLGRLGHNLSMAVGFVEAASVLGLPRGLVPLANLAHVQTVAFAGVKRIEIPEREVAESGEPDVTLLGELVEAGEFDRVEAVLRALAFDTRADEAYRPLLVAASADPGFLGHTLSLVHSARLASRHLTPSENAWLSWKLYRTLTAHFGYPEFLQLGEPETTDQEAILAAFESSLRYKSPSAETTVRQALEAGISLDDLLAAVVDFYGNWTVGEKEHTIALLGAAVETARFLGRDGALLPLAVALMRLPF